jgi:hypothetical protein
MHGKLALHQPQYGIIPIAVSLLTIIWTTIFLTWIQTYVVADDVEDLALAYLLPTVFIAVLQHSRGCKFIRKRACRCLFSLSSQVQFLYC